MTTLKELRDDVELTLHWSRKPGTFVNKLTGVAQDYSSPFNDGPQFIGSVAEWYNVVVETLVDLHNSLRLETDDVPQGPMQVVPPNLASAYASPDVVMIIEQTVLYQTNSDANMGLHLGTLSHRFKIYKSLVVGRNEVLVKMGNGRVGCIKVLDLNII